jgi:hypothetical protein
VAPQNRATQLPAAGGLQPVQSAQRVQATTAAAASSGAAGTSAAASIEIDPQQVDAARSDVNAELRRAGAPPLPEITYLDITGPQPRALTAEEGRALMAMETYVQHGHAHPFAPQRGPAAQGAAAMAQDVLAAAQHNELGGMAAQAHGPTGAFVRAARLVQECVQRIQNSVEFVQRVNANTGFGGAATVAASASNVAARNFASVFVPTAIRQFLSYGFEAAMQRTHASDTTRTVLGAAVPMLAVGALAAGAVRDRMAGTNTPTSERSRAIMATATAATGIATVATGSMRHVAPLMLAFTAYTAMRDLLVQSRLRMENPNTERSNYTPDAAHFALISVGYGLDQALVDFTMSTRASPSGASAFTDDAGPRPQVGNAFARAGINWVGEVAEDLTFQGIEAVRSRLDTNQPTHPLQLSIEDVGYERSNVLNGVMGPWAVRTGILSVTLGLTQILADHANRSLTSKPLAMAAASAAIVGAVNGILYEPFANAGSGQPTGNENAANQSGVAAPLGAHELQDIEQGPATPDRPATPPGGHSSNPPDANVSVDSFHTPDTSFGRLAGLTPSDDSASSVGADSYQTAPSSPQSDLTRALPPR